MTNKDMKGLARAYNIELDKECIHALIDFNNPNEEDRKILKEKYEIEHQIRLKKLQNDQKV